MALWVAELLVTGPYMRRTTVRTPQKPNTPVSQIRCIGSPKTANSRSGGVSPVLNTSARAFNSPIGGLPMGASR